MTDLKEISNQSFEQAISELEQIIVALEQGELPLEDALKQFERAVKLSRLSQEKLQAAEQKVKVLIEKQGAEQLVDVSADNLGDPSGSSEPQF
ncbi:exodeoxyribonuclease VII small subunit [Aliidiomarina quisquiliarum]|uniref:exodeoxyribonuclease VII small subunit n=1 Tax=Aliidiomarina quisquiliarum TaxID=2938947 RepID=UPI00208F3A42|nr:exodeoxyribonuclease VII small subunit [Aliidiomarina quisquiliarum]MCO4322692.1 exodeoxyribonuclease VII small subunit [Aliidiomarina quisquiliarum]